MMPLDNKHTESLEEYTCGPFKEVFVEQIRTARDSVTVTVTVMSRTALIRNRVSRRVCT